MKVISMFAIVFGAAAFSSGLICFLVGVFQLISPFRGDFDYIGLFLVFVTFPLCVLFWPIAAVGLVLSTVALFAEPNKILRVVGLLFVLFGICLFLTSYVL